MEKNYSDPLAAFNQLYKEMDEIYHQYAREHGISDTAFWLLYSLCLSDAPYTQREICLEWHYPPQTLNSALKTLEKQGLIALEPVPGNQKNKLVVLTEQGKAVVHRVIFPVIAAEQQSFRELHEEEKEALLSLTRKYLELLKSNIRNNSSDRRKRMINKILKHIVEDDKERKDI